MARSLNLDCKDKIEFEHNRSIKEIYVTVDGQKDNASFTVTTIVGDWFSYSIERGENYVKVILRIQKNLSTMDRFGTIKFEHNCANIIKYVSLEQHGVDYSLTANYDNGWQFKSIPDEAYEEKSVSLEAKNGRGLWCVKEIQQYQTLMNDGFDDKDVKNEYCGTNDQDALMEQVRVPYDGVFNYRIEGNKLIVRSYGQIDLITKKKTNGNKDYLPHMRYFFVLSHCDVNNSNKEELESRNVKYSDRKLFIFDGNDGNSLVYNEKDEPIITPLVSNT